MKKTIALYPFNQKRHSIYGPTIDLLSREYILIYTPQETLAPGPLFRFLRKRYPRYIYLKFLRPFLPQKKPAEGAFPPCDLIFASNSIPSKGDYVLDLEIVTALGGYDYEKLDKKRLEREFSEKRCRAIICWNQASKESLLQTLACASFRHKISVIPFSINSTPVSREKHATVNLLFVSSLNNPLDLELKGGIIALETYALLKKDYPSLTLTVRSQVSEKIKKKYGCLDGLTIIDRPLSAAELEKLFSQTDILLEPVPGFGLLLDCMNFKIPAIIFDFWALPEMVHEGKNGFVVDSSILFGNKKYMPEYVRTMNFRLLNLYESRIDQELLRTYVEKAKILIENEGLRKKMGDYAKSMLGLQGDYSLVKRDKKLLRVIHRALRGRT